MSCCSEKPNCCVEKPLKPGYERIRESCGFYYDRPIIGEGQEKCDNCWNPFPKGTLHTSGATKGLERVCEECLRTGSIKHCCKCNVFVYDALDILGNDSQFGYFYNNCKKMRTRGLPYCNKCMPPILWYLDIGKPYYRTIEIPIPKDKEYGISHDYFFDAAAEKLGIPVERIMIGGEKKKASHSRCMTCPAEYEKIEHKTLKVTICD